VGYLVKQKTTKLRHSPFPLPLSFAFEFTFTITIAALYWTAPEHLREHYSDLNGPLPMKLRSGSQEGDMYAVAIIVKEVFCRNGPYTEHEAMEPIGKSLRGSSPKVL
jgi:hypothetical protein